MGAEPRGRVGLFSLLAGDGRPLIGALGLALVGAGLFASLQAASGHLLPHDQAYLGMTAADLHGMQDGRVLHFMIHDRVAFGGALVAVGVLYLFLAAGPLADRRVWAWWALVLSGAVGFASFMTYVGHGYLDSWHGVATLLLAPLFVTGLWRSWRTLETPRGIGVLRRPAVGWPWLSPAGVGWLLLLLTAGCIAMGGLIIMTVGMTSVFVPQDLTFMGLKVVDLEAVSPRLIPLIAHDRAGFGGAVCCTGMCLMVMLWSGRPTPAMWQAVVLANVAGFGSAVGVHFPIGYLSFTHLAPAYLGVLMFVVGAALSWRAVHRGGE